LQILEKRDRNNWDGTNATYSPIDCKPRLLILREFSDSIHVLS